MNEPIRVPWQEWSENEWLDAVKLADEIKSFDYREGVAGFDSILIAGEELRKQCVLWEDRHTDYERNTKR